VAADVLAEAEQLAVGGEEAGGMEPAGRGEGGLGRTQPFRKIGEERSRNLELAFDPRGFDGDGLEPALAADAARGAV
jgi:hypothetical protein